MTQFSHGSTAFNASLYSKDAYNPIPTHGASIIDHPVFAAQQRPDYTQQRPHNSYNSGYS